MDERLAFDFGQGGKGRNQSVSILFSPDGSIGKDSPKRVAIRQGDDEWIAVVQSENQMHYELESATNSTTVALQ